MGFRIGIDSGGTFTDLQAVDDLGQMQVVKVPSTPGDPAQGVCDALEAFRQRMGGSDIVVDAILHGTTVAVNAILERKIPSIGLLVTRGFRHILELARQTVPGERGSIYVWVKPPRIVPLANVQEVTERLDHKGAVMTPFDADDGRRAARWYKDQGITTVAICFINSYADGVHERLARDIFREEHGDCLVSISSETLPEYREYERAITTCMNALLMPVLGEYVAKLQDRIAAMGIDAPLYMMKSGGGASRADLAIEQPIYTALSGPAAAVVGAAWLGRAAGYDNIITFDMGGTSTDVSLVENGHPTLVTEIEIDGYPIRAPTIDVISVGAGGGSVAWLAPGDRLRVGPRSAGAYPGPGCYSRGGTEPTITDANLFLGRLPDTLAGGAVALDRGEAERVLTTFGKRIGLGAVEMAHGILEIAELNMADAIRQVSVQKGRDPRLFSLMASGGAGPLHASSLGEILGIPKVVIPPLPGMGCSLGALVSDVREDYVITDIQHEANVDRERVRAHFGELEAKASKALARQGFAGSERSIVRSADMRYRGMRTELTVSVTSDKLDDAAIDAMFMALHRAHETAYGYSYEGKQQVELVNLRVAGLGHMADIAPPVAPSAAAGAAPTGQRRAYFGAHGWIETPVYARASLAAGTKLTGPVIVDQYDSTTVILAGQTAIVDGMGNIMIATAAGRADAERAKQQTEVLA